jgi:hypothetical protein
VQEVQTRGLKRQEGVIKRQAWQKRDKKEGEEDRQKGGVKTCNGREKIGKGCKKTGIGP